MVKEYLWLRLGDNTEYNTESSVDDLTESFHNIGITEELVRYGRYGITDKDIFTGENYISLYYGDDDAQPTRPIEREELEALNRRLKECQNN